MTYNIYETQHLFYHSTDCTTLQNSKMSLKVNYEEQEPSNEKLEKCNSSLEI